MENTDPSIRLTVCPKGSDKVDFMDVTYELGGHSWAAGEDLFSVNLETVTIPFCPMMGLSAGDDAGELPLIEEMEEKYPIILKKWKTARETVGPVRFSYRVVPRVVPDDYRSSPYFDFRNEDGGANGAGITFLAEIKGMDSCRMRFDWDLDGMPEGSSGVATYGEGSFETEGKPNRLTNAYYAAGTISSIAEDDFGFYWLSEPSFDIKETADWARNLFLRMAAFFGDSSGLYRIFARKDPFKKSGGGTALYRSYMFGYSDAMVPTLSALKNLLAHEMVHNWTQLKDEPYGTGTWYSEGTAEYYSVMLPLRFGFATPGETLEQIKKRTQEFYTSPLRNLSNAEAARVSWADRRAQRIAYGRGFFFLANLDVRIKKLTGGRHNLDDVVKELAKRPFGEFGTNEDVICLVRDLTGWNMTEELGRMADGEPFAPEPESFDGWFGLQQVERRETDTENTVNSWEWTLKEKTGGHYDV